MSISMAKWPLTVHLLRDAEREPSLIEGRAVAVREDGRPFMSVKDEVRLKWHNQDRGWTSREPAARPAPKAAESLDDAMLEKTLRPVLVETKEQLVLLEEWGMVLLSRGSRSRRFDLVRCLEDKGLSEEESDGAGSGGRRLPLG